MTAVASPIQFQPPSRTGWSSISGSQTGLSTMSSDDMSVMFAPGPRKTAQRANSSSSLASSTSSTSATSTSSAQSNGSISVADSWATRKKPSRGIWPPGKSEPTAGISAARPQPVSSTSSGPSAASAISALHAPMLPSQQTNGQTQQNGTIRGPSSAEQPPALLYLLPLNGTFERKTINVPFYPDVLRIGRQTNAKTAPTPANGFFDSKVLSRQHAEVYAERNGRVFIRDIKSSNGTFVNGKRLSPENKESEPNELREQDTLELGIDIVSEDQKTVVHHKVAARVEHAGIYSSSGDMNFGELDPSAGGGLMAQQMKRTGSQTSVQGAKANVLAAAAMAGRDGNGMQQQGWSRMWLQPISTEHIVKRLNRELGLAKQQSQDIGRAKQLIEGMLEGSVPSNDHENKRMSDKPANSSPVRTKPDSKAKFSDPPAPPPQQPLPEKPDVAKALADPVIQPLLQRSDTARPFGMGNTSPTKADHSQALLILTHELKVAKDQIPNLVDRVKNLEEELRAERTARESAEERAHKLESGSRTDSSDSLATLVEDSEAASSGQTSAETDKEIQDPVPDVQGQLDRLRATMEEMKQQMEAYRQRAESAEYERDASRKTLAEMVEQKRKEHAVGQTVKAPRSRSPQPKAVKEPTQECSATNGHAVAPTPDGQIAMMILLERAGVDGSKTITKQQASTLQNLLSQELGAPQNAGGTVSWGDLSYQGVPHACALTTVMLGLALMHYLNGWEKVQR